VLTYVFLIIATAGVFAALYYLMAEGFRNGDRPADAAVTAQLTTGPRPEEVRADEARPVIVVTVRNPAGTPVLVALRARRSLRPALLGEPHGVSVARLTGRRKFRPGAYPTVGVAPAGGRADFTVPVAVPVTTGPVTTGPVTTGRARGYLLTAAVGQEGGRLRVHRLRLGSASHQAQGRDELFSPFTLR
jgi:hypothetical protein